MSKYIDADLYVEMQIYDDEHEDWLWWKGSIEELLDQWTEEGCPTPIEVSEDCIYTYCSRCGMRVVVDAPSVVPSRAEGEWIKQFNGTKCVCSICGYSNGRKHNDNYCPNCGAKTKG